MRNILVAIGLVLFSISGFSQTKKPLEKWSVEIGSGLGFDLLDYISRNDNALIRGPASLPDPDYRTYSDRTNSLVLLGRMDHARLSYLWNRNNTISFGVKYFYWEEYYGWKKDRLELWKDVKNWSERRIYNLDWSRRIIGSSGEFQYGIGAVYQLRVSSVPRYVIRSDESVGIDANRYKPFFPDVGLSLRLSKYWNVFPNVQLGITGYTHTLLGFGFDTAGLLLSTKIDFSPRLDNEKKVTTSSERMPSQSKMNLSFSFGSGMFQLLRYSENSSNPFGDIPGYSGSTSKRPSGKSDRLGITLGYDRWSLELAYSHVRYKELFDHSNDPLAFWERARNLQKQNLVECSLGYDIAILNKIKLIPRFGLVARKDYRFTQFYDLNLNGTLNSIGINIFDSKWETGLNSALGLEYEISDRTSFGVKVISNYFNKNVGMESLSINAYARMQIF